MGKRDRRAPLPKQEDVEELRRERELKDLMSVPGFDEPDYEGSVFKTPGQKKRSKWRPYEADE